MVTLLQADREIAPDVRIWRAVQHQRRLPDTDTNADTPASEEAIKVGRLSHVRRLCPVTASSAIGKRLTVAQAAARAVINNNVLPSSNDMSRVAAATP